MPSKSAVRVITSSIPTPVVATTIMSAPSSASAGSAGHANGSSSAAAAAGMMPDQHFFTSLNETLVAATSHNGSAYQQQPERPSTPVVHYAIREHDWSVPAPPPPSPVAGFAPRKW